MTQTSTQAINGKIAFARQLSISEVYVANADSSNEKNLTDSQGFDGAPVWSPDGSRIAFESGRDGNGEIYVMNADGSSPTRLTNDPATDYGPVWSPDGTRIAFIRYLNDNSEIHVMNADGGNQTRLTNDPARDIEPTWSPDGSRIAYIRYQTNNYANQQIYVMDADGSNQRQLTNDPAYGGQFTWSPDSSRMAFSARRSGSSEIYVMNADGGNQTRLTFHIGNSYDPAWSPDGTKIAFANEAYDNGYIYVMNADGSNQTRLTNDGGDYGPVWSPDGARIAFNRGGDIYVTNADGSGQTRIANNSPGFANEPRWSPDGLRITFGRHIYIEPEIYVMNADGCGLLNLTNHPAIDRYPTWSPDGTRIAFVSYRDFDSINIYVMNADGSGQTRLTSLPGFNIDPDWSPDGTKIAFAHWHDGNSAIYVMNADGSNLTRLIEPGTLYGSPAWSPDGTRIAFARYDNGGQEIYVMNADGSGQINLTNNTGFDSSPAWSPDGSKIVFEQIQNPNTDIYVMNSDGSNQTRLTDDSPGFEGEPVWAPDGSRIAFISSRAGSAEIYLMNSDGNNRRRLTQNLDAYNLDPDWQTLLAASTSTVQFSSQGYSAGEEAGNVVITVQRTGDASRTATVAYTTSDDVSFTNCKTVNGKASSRCDYSVASGTLQFGAGEMTKAFSLSVVDDAYIEGSEVLSLTLSSPEGATLGALSTAPLTITDNDNGSATNPIDDAQFFVRQQYLDFLNREPDPVGFQFWTSEITSCGADPQCKEIKRINVSAAFFMSIEFQETGYFTYLASKAAYGEGSSPGAPGTVPIIRLAEFLPDSQSLGHGVRVGIGDWQTQLDSNKQTFALEFVQRQRFADAFPSSMSADAFVSKLDQQAGGVLSAHEKVTLVALLAPDPAEVQLRARVLRAVADDDDLRQAEFTRAFVLMQYYGYLRRNPDDAPDSNFGGWRFWLSKLDQFNGNFVHAEMVKGFLAASEYRQRFGQP